MTTEHPTLSIRKGAPLASVQAALGIKHAPQRSDDPDEDGTFYHLEETGFWVFFDKDNRVYSIRFDAPYPYAVEGVKIGDSGEQVLNSRGKPDRYLPMPGGQFRWVYDRPAFLRVDLDPETQKVFRIFR